MPIRKLGIWPAAGGEPAAADGFDESERLDGFDGFFGQHRSEVCFEVRQEVKLALPHPFGARTARRRPSAAPPTDSEQRPLHRPRRWRAFQRGDLALRVVRHSQQVELGAALERRPPGAGQLERRHVQQRPRLSV
jgi:hypothetical protein